jgi:Domain of unknown function (DUF4124)
MESGLRPMNAGRTNMPSRRDIMHMHLVDKRDRACAFAAPAFPMALLLASVLCAAQLLLVPAARAATYKWVDDQGVVHYTDKMPPEAINKGSVELNKQGVPIKKTEPALTPEQRRARAEEEERQRQEAKVRDETARKDRALLQTYTTESEIDLARKRALGTIDAQIQSAQAYTATLAKRKQDIQARVAALGDKPLPPALDRELANANEELEKQIAAKRKEMAVVNARYDADKQRWQELAAMAPTKEANVGSSSSTTPVGYTGGAKR